MDKGTTNSGIPVFGAIAHTVIKADEDVPYFVNITDATVSDQPLLKGLFRILPRGSWLSFDMGYVHYEAWQEFTDNGIFYVTKEKKRGKHSYINLYDFLNLTEGQWLRIIQNWSPEDEISPQLELFPQKEGPNFENYKTMENAV